MRVTIHPTVRIAVAPRWPRSRAPAGNVEVITDSRVHRILFDGTRAVGVEVARGGALETIRAEREVILSAGTYHSPQLLHLSGIGPADMFAPFGMECRHDLPVGQR